MIKEFLSYYEALHNVKQSLVLDLSHNKTCGWCCEIVHRDSGTIIYSNDNCSLNLIAAAGYVALEEWAIEFDDLADIESNL